jgi:hypothetical protein
MTVMLHEQVVWMCYGALVMLVFQLLPIVLYVTVRLHGHETEKPD